MNTRHILILENDRQYFDFLIDQLSFFGYAKTQFFHAQMFEELNTPAATTFSPDVIFACFNNQDNEEVIKKYKDIQLLFPLAAVVIFSEKDEDELAVKCVQAGAQSFLGKGKLSPSQLYRVAEFSHERNKHSPKKGDAGGQEQAFCPHQCFQPPDMVC